VGTKNDSWAPKPACNKKGRKIGPIDPTCSSFYPFFHPLLFPSASIRTRPPWKEQILDHKVTGVFFSKKTQTRQGNLQGSWKQPEKGTSNNSPLCKKPDLVSYMQGLSRNKKPDLVSYM
jgi:hypothetical protein